MKKLITISFIIAALCGVRGYALDIPYNECMIQMDNETWAFSDQQVTFPVKSIAFSYWTRLIGKESKNAVATLHSSKGPVATGTLSTDVPTTYLCVLPNPVSSVIVKFDEPLILPRGESYKIVVPAGSFNFNNKIEDPQFYNDEFSAEFFIPDTLSPEATSIHGQSDVANVERIGFGFMGGINVEEGSEFTLFREDKPIKKYPVNFWKSIIEDYYLMEFVGIDFGKDLGFENGVKYSLELSKGSVSAMHRPEIACNSDCLKISFTGSSKEEVIPVRHSRTNVAYFRSLLRRNGSCGEIRFYYNRKPGQLGFGIDPKVLLEEDGTVIKEVTPVLTEENGFCVMVADFEETPANPEKQYSILIPEGTLISQEGIITLNQRNVLSVNGTTDIQEIDDTDMDVNIEKGILTLNGIEKGTHTAVYSLDGKQIHSAVSEGGTVEIPVPDTGIYILKVGERVRKINVK